MLDEFVSLNRNAILARTRARVAPRTSPTSSDLELTNGIPVFLQQLGVALRLARSSDVIDHEQIAASAGRHGHGPSSRPRSRTCSRTRSSSRPRAATSRSRYA